MPTGDKKKMLDNLKKSLLKNYHFLKVLQQFLSDNQDFRAAKEYVYELKRLFPDGNF